MTNIQDDQLRDKIAEALQTTARCKIMDRIADGVCSASMSGIEYFPRWAQADEKYRAPFYEQADAILALAEREKRYREALEEIANYSYQYGQRVQLLKAMARRALGEEKAS